MDFMAGGAGEQQAAMPAMVPNGNPIADAMDGMNFGASPTTPAEDPFQGMPVSNSGPAVVHIGTDVPEVSKLREWESKHEEELEKTARAEEAARRETREKAAAELAKWHQDRKADTSKRVEVNRAQEKEMEAGRLAAMKPDANPWERVVDLIDTNSRTADEARDTSRMRSLLIQLKSNPV